MSVWTYPISWSKMRMAWKCLRMLQYAIDKKPPTDVGPNYYMRLGWWVQYTFELYFNKGLNRTKGGRRVVVMGRVVDRVLASGKFNNARITYPHTKTEKDLRTNIRAQVMNGHRIFETTGLLGRPIKSEVKYRSVFRGIRLYAQIDFLWEDARRVNFYDGKGSVRENADPRQLLMYALALAAAGKKLGEAALIYWNHGKRPVNVSPGAIREFVAGDFGRAYKVFNRLKHGISEELTPSPSRSTCHFCSWKSICPASPYVGVRRDDILDLEEEVSFGDG